MPDDRYFVYVIALAPAALPWRLRGADNSPQCLYVGESWHTPECRREQHRAGYRASRKVWRHGRDLRSDLYEFLNPLYSQEEAEKAEVELARVLTELGYHVYMGQ